MGKHTCNNNITTNNNNPYSIAAHITFKKAGVVIDFP